MSGFNQNQNNHHDSPPLDPKQLEQLNAYLDYELSEAEREQMRDLLRHSPAAENEMATLKATSKVLSELPNVAAPRSFAVRPAMLERPVRNAPPFSIFGWRPTSAIALSLGSVVAACLLVLVLVVQLASNNNNQANQNPSLAMAPAPTSAPAGSTNTFSYAAPTISNSAGQTPPSAMAQATPSTATVAESANSASSTMPPSSAKLNPTPAADSTSSDTAPAPSSAANNGSDNGGSAAGSAGESAPTDTPAPHIPEASINSGNQPSATPELKVAAQNPTDNGGNVAATNPGVTDQNTNRTGDSNLNPYQKGMDYWLILEIALAILVVMLGLGAILAQRRNR